MSEARDFAADLLTGRRTRIDDEPQGGPRGPIEGVFRDVRAALAELEALYHSNPDEALQELRGLLNNDALTARDLESFLDVWKTAIDDSQTFQRRVSAPDVRGIGDWWDHLRGYLHRPADATPNDQAMIDQMIAKGYVLASTPFAKINPHERVLETLDPAWVSLLRAKLGEKSWPEGLIDMPRHSQATPFVYEALGRDDKPLAKGAPHSIALLSDFGTGYYHSWGIANQLAAWGLPYSFHLGDVYYAGRPDEFSHRFELPLSNVVGRTRFFGLPENHELYGGGAPYLSYFGELHDRGFTPQEGSYFCVRFPEHQIIAIDVNWQGRQRYRDPALVAWLQARLAEADGRTNILLTGSAPYGYGSATPRALHDDLAPLITDQIGLWFWGDDHYCALFGRTAELPFYGSCIGHGGFPGNRLRDRVQTCNTTPMWIEDAARFPDWTGLRPDMTNNGWVHATLQPGGGVDLVYVDWLSCERAGVSFARDGKTLRHVDPIRIFDRESAPRIHRPS